MQSLRVTESSELAQARRTVLALATNGGFDETAAGRAALVATEICSNLIKHGGGGELLVRRLEDARGAGLELIGIDKGPGMTDIGQCLRDGFSTGGSPGTGLGAIERQSQLFDVYSQPGKGAAVMAHIWADATQRVPDATEVGAIVVPKPGEQDCGDAWCCTRRAGGVLILAVDGLGHGLGAAQAAATACRMFEAEKHRPLPEILQLVHGALRSTRGAAVSLVDMDWSAGRATTACVGNVTAAIVSGGVAKRVAADNGIVGHVVSKVRELHYPCVPDSVLVLHSDGVATNWQPERYPGLMQHHSTLIAAVLYRDCNRGRDDSLIVVAKQARQ
jgi:anti-sigma regulatory factor (Ser/Thr protein kinase)